MTSEKEAAYILYRDGLPQIDICKILGKTAATLTKWKTEGDWDKKRTEAMLKRQQAEDDIWEVINYNLKVLKHTKDKYNKEWENGEEPKLLAKGSIDGIRDLFKCVSMGRNVEWSEYVKIIRELLGYIRKRDQQLAKEVSEVFDDFLNEKRKTLE